MLSPESRPNHRRANASTGILCGRLILVGLLGALSGAAQDRIPVERVPFTIARQVRDISPAQQRYASAMTAPVRLGDRSVAWVQTGYSSYVDSFYPWSLDLRSGRATLLKEATPLYNPLYVPEPLLLVGDRIYFTAFDFGLYATMPSHSEPLVLYLWATDGTPEGTAPVKGPEGVGFEYPAGLTLLDGNLYFFAYAGSSDYRLWKIDGSRARTAIGDVRGIPPEFVGFEGNTAVGLFQQGITDIGGKRVFPAPSASAAALKPYALYRLSESGSDATLLRDFGSPPGLIVEMGGIGYFRASESLGNDELWRTDGTPEGTERVRDICPGSCGSYPDTLTAVGASLYFTARDDTHGTELWKSDGTEAGTTLVKDIRPGLYGQPPHNFVVAGHQLFFLEDDGEHGEELWLTDGTTAGTRLVKDIRPGPEGCFPSGLVALGSWLFFSADDGIHGRELWRTDGTEAGTVMVMDISPGSAGSSPQSITPYEGAVYFSADDSVHGRELWRTDATSLATRLVADLLPGAEGSDPFLFVDAGMLSVLAVTPDGLSLLNVKGPTPEIARLALLDESGTRGVSSSPRPIADLGGQLLFLADGLWATDGTEAGTRRFEQVGVHIDSAPAAAGESLYFSGYAEGGSVNDRFYRFDLSTETLHELAKGYASPIAAVGEIVYYVLNSDASELWKSDANSGEETLLKKVNGGIASLTPAAGLLYFSVFGTSPAIWKSDGTEVGTVAVVSGTASGVTGAAGWLFFTSNDYVSKTATLWRMPFFEPTTSRVRNFPQDPVFGSPFSDMTGSGNLIFFLVRDVSAWAYQLWRSDGTEAGTYRLSEVSAQRGSLRAAGSGVYFVARDGDHGRELWTSDGTPQGTVLVKDINPGFSDSNPYAVAVIDGVAVFSADDGFHGHELWRSDGTADGTFLLDDICPNACSSFPHGFMKSGPRIFFAANDHETGDELWAMPASALVSSASGRRPNHDLPWRR